MLVLNQIAVNMWTKQVAGELATNNLTGILAALVASSEVDPRLGSHSQVAAFVVVAMDIRAVASSVAMGIRAIASSVAMGMQAIAFVAVTVGILAVAVAASSVAMDIRAIASSAVVSSRAIASSAVVSSRAIASSKVIAGNSAAFVVHQLLLVALPLAATRTLSERGRNSCLHFRSTTSHQGPHLRSNR